MNAAIAKGLVDIATKIGRWILGVVVRRGALFLRDYMAERVLVFRARLAKAKTTRRQQWLKGRIARWTAAAKWLSAKAGQLARCATSEFDELLKRNRGLPLTAQCERLAR
jgi:hypothetical protein